MKFPEFEISLIKYHDRGISIHVVLGFKGMATLLNFV